MNHALEKEISRFVAEDTGNRFTDGTARYFNEPLVGFASAANPLFSEYKNVIGDFHLTPEEMVAVSTPNHVWIPSTVVCWVLPITAETRTANRHERSVPSKEWAHTRHFGEQFNSTLRRHVMSWLQEQGYHAAAPQLMSAWHEVSESPAGIASTWSERHAAYAAGLGTFSLNDALITAKGIAHRLGSVITDCPLEPSVQTYSDRRSNCLYFREQRCGVCIARCPVGAISRSGHDKNICRTYVYGALAKTVAPVYGVTAAGCGLCQTKVPCESRIP